MSEDDSISFWRNGAKRALKAAMHLCESADYEMSLFTCHLAAEKALKYLCVKKTHGTPPRTHNLVDLCEVADLAIDVEEKNALRELTSFAEFGRYGDDSWLEADATHENASHWIDFTNSHLDTWLD
jgi:HEPN domain-containing protein